MAKPFRPKRGTTAKNDAFTGLASEITIDTEKHSIRVHDGVTAGGHEILPKAKNDLLYEKAGRNPNDFLITATGTPDARPLANRFADIVNVKDFGAVGDGVTDDTAAIQAALDYARLNNKRCFGQGRFYVTATISIRCSCDFGDAIFVAHGATVSPVVEVGPRTYKQGELLRRKFLTLPSVENLDKPEGQVGWNGLENSVGMQFLTCCECEFKINRIVNFYVGAWVSGFGTLCAYNTFTVNHLHNNHTNLLVKPLDTTKDDGSEAEGWCNQNVFIGGRYSINSGEVADGQIHVAIRVSEKLAGSGYTSNNLTFVGCSFEGNNAYAIECSGRYHYFLNCRYEFNRRVLLRAAPGVSCSNNVFEGGYEVDAIEFTKDAQTDPNGVLADGEIKYNRVSAAGTFKLPTVGGNGFAALSHYSSDGPTLRGYGQRQELTDAKKSDGDWLWQFNRNNLEIKTYIADDSRRARFYGSGLEFSNGTEYGYKLEINPNYGQFTVGRISEDTYQKGYFAPTFSGSMPLGHSSRLWSEVFSSTGAINTSDERSKVGIHNPEDALMRAWGKVNFKVFQFKDAYETKGEDARLHVGVVAQQVIEAFDSEGLDATRYGLLCYDKWDDQYDDIEVVDEAEVVDERGEVVTPAKTRIEQKLVIKAGDRYGIRYEEALALECAYQRWRMDNLEKRLS